MFPLVFLLFLFSVNADYYWKDFYGEIPSDAFPAGTDGGGNPTYVGQTFFLARNKLFPTIIERGNKFAYVEHGGKISSDNLTKILCSNNHSLFRWVPTDIKKMRFLTGCRQVSCGTDSGALLTVGRANHLGRTITGRVADNDAHGWHGLWIHDLQFKNVHLNEFEILTYNCTNPYLEVV